MQSGSSSEAARATRWRSGTVTALEDVADEPFAAPEIRRLEELRLRASESAIDADLAAGRHTRGTSASSTRSSPPIRCVSTCMPSGCSRSTEPGGSRRPWRPTARPARRWSMRSGSSQEFELRGLHEQVLSQTSGLDLAPPARAATSAPRPPPPRHRRGLLLGAGALLLAGVLAFGVIRMLEPDGLPGIDEDAVGAIDPGSGKITAQYAVGHGHRRWRPCRLGLGRQPARRDRVADRP